MNNHSPCTDWEEKLALREEDLSPSDRIALNAHLSKCPVCSATRNHYNLLITRLRTLPPPTMKPLSPLLVQYARPSSVENPRISVVIPALNEARNLLYVLPHLPSIVSEVILVDGGSTDDTTVVAQQLLPTIRIIKQVSKGKGNALRIGLTACTGDIIVTLDADGSNDPNEIPRFIEALLARNDFAKGSRFMKGGGSSDITALRRLGSCLLSSLANLLFGTRYSDLLYGYNAFWRHCFDSIEIDCDGFEVEALINLRIHKANLKIVEVPSFEHPRLYGRSNLRVFRDGWRVLKTIIEERTKNTPHLPHSLKPIDIASHLLESSKDGEWVRVN